MWGVRPDSEQQEQNQSLSDLNRRPPSSIGSLSPASDPAGTSLSSFEIYLKTSRVYRRAKRHSMDYSFRSSIVRPGSWSVFSGLSLNDISVISVIALPITADDLTNPQHYVFEDHESQETVSEIDWHSNASRSMKVTTEDPLEVGDKLMLFIPADMVRRSQVSRRHQNC